MKETKNKKKFKVIKLTPYVISIWGDNGYLSLRTLLRNLCNKKFCKKFLQNNKEMLSDEKKMSDNEIIDNLVFLYNVDFDVIKEDYPSIRLFLSENLARFSDEKFWKKYTSVFYIKFKELDIWIDV